MSLNFRPTLSSQRTRNSDLFPKNSSSFISITQPNEYSFEETNSQYEKQIHNTKAIMKSKSKERKELERILNTDEPNTNEISFIQPSNKNDPSLIQINENSYHFAKLLNQIVEKICNDVEGRITNLEAKMELFEKIIKERNRLQNKENMMHNNNKDHSLSRKEMYSKEDFFIQKEQTRRDTKDFNSNRESNKIERKLEDLESAYNSIKSEVFLRQSQFSLDLDSHTQKINELSESVDKKILVISINLKDEMEKKILGSLLDLKKEFNASLFDFKKEINKIKESFTEVEIKGVNQKVLIKKIEDDMVRMFGSMKDLNEVTLMNKYNMTEIANLKKEFYSAFLKRSRSYREKV